MNGRIMVKLLASEDGVSLRTYSRGHRSPHGFILADRELRELEERRFMTVSDIRSFAELALCRTMEQTEDLEVRFTWLRDAGGGAVTGMVETVRIAYEEFRGLVKESREDGGWKRVLSLEDGGRVRITFQSRKNLKAVAETKTLRKKLGKFMGSHFLGWKGGREITMYDDFEPYSFFFLEQTPYGDGICGGVILHNRENPEKAYYGIHT